MYIPIRPTGVAILTKHYNNLWMGLPEDHMITVERFFDMYEICDDGVVDKLVSSTNSEWSNRMILNKLISQVQNDYQLLGFSFLIERLATGAILVSDCPNIASFRIG